MYAPNYGMHWPRRTCTLSTMHRLKNGSSQISQILKLVIKIGSYCASALAETWPMLPSVLYRIPMGKARGGQHGKCLPRWSPIESSAEVAMEI